MQNNYYSIGNGRQHSNAYSYDLSKAYSTNSSSYIDPRIKHASDYQTQISEEPSKRNHSQKIQLNVSTKVSDFQAVEIDPQEYEMRKSALLNDHFEAILLKKSQNQSNTRNFMTNPSFSNQAESMDSSKIQELYRGFKRETYGQDDSVPANADHFSHITSLKTSLVQSSPPHSFDGDQKISKNLFDQLRQIAQQKSHTPSETDSKANLKPEAQKQAMEKLMHLFQTNQTKTSQFTENVLNNESDFLQGLDSEIQDLSKNLISNTPPIRASPSDAEKLLMLDRLAQNIQEDINTNIPSKFGRQISNLNQSMFPDDKFSLHNHMDLEEIYTKFNNKDIKLPSNAFEMNSQLNFGKNKPISSDVQFFNLKAPDRKIMGYGDDDLDDDYVAENHPPLKTSAQRPVPQVYQQPKVMIKLFINSFEVPVFIDDDSGTIALRYCQLSSTKMLPSKMAKLKEVIKTSVNQRISALVRQGKGQSPIPQSPISRKQQSPLNYVSQPKPIRAMISNTDITPDNSHISNRPIKNQPQASYKNLYESRKETKVQPSLNHRPSPSPSPIKKSSKQESESQVAYRPPPPVQNTSAKQYQSTRPAFKSEPEEMPKKAPSPMPNPARKNSATVAQPKPEITASKLLEQFNIPLPRPINKPLINNTQDDYLNKLEERYQPIDKQRFQQQEDPDFDIPHSNLPKDNQTQSKKAIDIDISKDDDPYIKALEIIEAQNLNFIYYDQIVEGIKAAQKNK